MQGNDRFASTRTASNTGRTIKRATNKCALSGMQKDCPRLPPVRERCLELLARRDRHESPQRVGVEEWVCNWFGLWYRRQIATVCIQQSFSDFAGQQRAEGQQCVFVADCPHIRQLIGRQTASQQDVVGQMPKQRRLRLRTWTLDLWRGRVHHLGNHDNTDAPTRGVTDNLSPACPFIGIIVMPCVANEGLPVEQMDDDTQVT